jgi:hypothetical protein
MVRSFSSRDPPIETVAIERIILVLQLLDNPTLGANPNWNEM